MGTKNCPETPRQKMINMMYLVLTALLALNVAAETLYAFKVVDLSLVRTFESFSRKNASVMSDFDWQVEKGQKPEMARHYRTKALDVHNSSEELIMFITELKTEMAILAKSEKVVPGEGVPEEYPYVVTEDNDTLILSRQDDLNISPLIMIERGKGEELKEKISGYKSRIGSIIRSDSTLALKLDSSFFENLNKILDVTDPDKKDITTDAKTWVQQNFDRTPLIASITMLSKIQSDVRFAENLILNTIYSAIKGDSYFEAKVIPKSTYIIAGSQKFEAEIFLSAITNVPQAEVYINGSSNPLVMDNGKVIYTSAPGKVGKYTYNGEIRYRNPEGFWANAPFKGEYEVAEPSATISPEKMNVFYRGIDNPVDISVPGVSSNALRVTINNGAISQNGNVWNVKPTSLTNTNIDVYASIEGREILMGTKMFRVKDVPPPKASLGGISSGNIPRAYFQTQQILKATLEDFLFDLEFEITGFDLSIATGGGMTTTFSSASERFTRDQTEVFNGLRRGDKVIFENIRAKIRGSNVVTNIPLSPTIFTVNN
jgi:gliding motility-associated protein GldM